MTQSWHPAHTWVTEEQFLELFKYTGPEVIPGEFLRSLNAVVNQQKKQSQDITYETTMRKINEIREADWHNWPNL